MANTSSLDIEKLTEQVAKADPSISIGDINVHGNIEGNIVVGNRNVVKTYNVKYEINTDHGAVANIFTGRPEITKRKAIPVRAPRTFIGRKKEVKILEKYIQDREAVLIYGQSGIGKTTLVKQIAHSNSAEDLADGVVFLEQPYEGNIPSLQDTLQRIFDRLFKSNPPVKYTDSIVEADLAQTSPLLILDEAGLHQDALSRLPDLFPQGALIVTGQDALSDDAYISIEVEALEREDAIRLFIEKSGLTEDVNARPIINEICEVLKDIPLAVATIANVIRKKQLNSDALKSIVEDLLAIKPLSRTHVKTAIERSFRFIYPDPDPNKSEQDQAGQEREQELLATVAAAPGKSYDRDLLVGDAQYNEAQVQALEDLELLYANSPRLRLHEGFGEIFFQLALKRKLYSYRNKQLNYLLKQDMSMEFVEAELGNILGILQWAFNEHRWNDVVKLGQAVDPWLTLHGLWDAWSDVLHQVQIAGRNIKDPKQQASIQAWAYHQLGTREIGVGNRNRAINLLRRSLMMRVSQGDIYGAAYTLHNLRIIMPPPNPWRRIWKKIVKTIQGTPWVILGILAGIAILTGIFLPPSLKLTKQATPTKYHVSGQVIEYSYIVENAALRPIPGPIIVNDDKVQVRCPALELIGNEDDQLDWNETITCAGYYSINDDDIEVGSVTNTATANATVDVGQEPVKSKPQSITISFDRDYLKLTMQASTRTYRNSGETITIAYNVSNDGTTKLNGPVNVTDDRTQVNCPDLLKINDFDDILSDREMLTCTSIFTITDADIKNGFVKITAQASAGEIKSDPQSIKIFKIPQSELTLNMGANPLTYKQAGQQITFTYKILNSGKQTLGPTQFTVSDSLISTTPINCGNADTTLAPGAVVTCNATYTITNADMILDSITNYATASGGDTVPSEPASTTINNSSIPRLKISDKFTLEMTVQADTSAPINTVGQNIQYTYNITNIGTEPLPGVVSIIGATALCPSVDTIGNLDEFLDSGETLTCVSSYTVVQADLDAGAITSVTTAEMNGILSNTVTTVVPTVANRILTLTQAAYPLVYERIGDTITYTYGLTNAGTVAIGPAQFTVTDERVSTPINCGGPDTTLDSGATLFCSATITITQADMEVDSISSNATASGGGVGPSEPASTTITKYYRVELSSLGLTKSAAPVTYQDVGQRIRYTYFVTNDGKYPLMGPLTIKDDKIDVNCPEINTTGDGDGVLDPGELLTCTSEYTITDLDIRNGSVTNEAVASMDGIESNPDSVKIIEEALILKKSADPVSYGTAGETITYTYEVTSRSGVPLAGPVIVTDSQAQGIKCQDVHEVGNLDVFINMNETITCIGQYVITQADIDDGLVTNSAFAIAGGIQSHPTTVTITASQTEALSLAVSANPANFDSVDQAINYTYVVTNTGNVSITLPIQITDDHIDNPQPFICGSDQEVLLPNKSVTCEASYVIVQADFEPKSVTNTAVASAGIIDSLPIKTTVSCQVPSNEWVPYTVESGETLSHISTWFDDTTEADLRRENCMGLSTRIIQGQLLYVPDTPPLVTILVTIFDNANIPLENTPVTLVNINNGSSQTEYTDANGNVKFIKLEPGSYQIFQVKQILRRGDTWEQNFVIVPVRPY